MGAELTITWVDGGGSSTPGTPTPGAPTPGTPQPGAAQPLGPGPSNPAAPFSMPTPAAGAPAPGPSSAPGPSAVPIQPGPSATPAPGAPVSSPAAGSGQAGFAGPSAQSILTNAANAAAKQGIGAAAGEVGAMAGPGAGAAASAIGGEVASLVAASGPAAIAVGGLAIAAGAAVVGTKMFVDTLSKASDDLKNLSPSVAGASARSDVLEQFAQMRRAEAVGPQLAQFERARGDINAKLADVQTQTLHVLLKIFQVLQDAGIVEFIKDSLGYMEAQGETMAEMIPLVKAYLLKDIPGFLAAWTSFEQAWQKQGKAAGEFFRNSQDDEMKAADSAFAALGRQLAAIGFGDDAPPKGEPFKKEKNLREILRGLRKEGMKL